jgi:F-type H+-transporting ATPase subunit epsilon
MADAFNFELVSPERLLFSEQVTAVVVPGSDGYFTVMANHAPMMTTIRPGVVEASLADGTAKRLFVRGGFADVSASGFTLLAEFAMPVEDLNADMIDTQIKSADDDLTVAIGDAKKQAALQQLNQLKELKSALGL